MEIQFVSENATQSVETRERVASAMQMVGIKWGKSKPVELKHTHLICIIFCVHTVHCRHTLCTNDCFWAASTVFAIDDNHLPFAIIDANLFWCRRNGDTKDMSNQDFPVDAEVKENRTALLFSSSFGCC